MLHRIRQRLGVSGRHRLSEYAAASAALRQRVRDLLVRVKEQERLTALSTDGSAELTNHATQHARATRKANLLARSDRPIVAGPWCGEVGFELLYWIPFVTWLVERARVERRRVTVLTRGGAHAWYRHLAGEDVEILDLVSAEAFRSHARALKQDALSRFDRDLLRRVVREAGLSHPHLLHPLFMYRLFIPYWKEEAVLEPITAFTRYRPLVPVGNHPAASGLPDDYVAVKFYFSQAFPDTPDNRSLVRRVVAGLSEQVPVVVLQSGARVDDHEDALVPEGPRVRIVRPDVRDNLAVQTAVVSRARAFVGTYGGFSYLAPLYGVNSLSFFSDREKLIPFHLEHANRVFGSLGAGRFIALDVLDAPVAAATLPRMVDEQVVRP